jgi:hypothetical protein
MFALIGVVFRLFSSRLSDLEDTADAALTAAVRNTEALDIIKRHLDL